MNRSTALIIVFALMGSAALAEDVATPPPAESAAEDSMLNMLAMRPGAEISEADRGYIKALQAMDQAMMKTEMSGNPSGDFVRLMVLHHQSAIAMADVLLQQKDVVPEIAEMAKKMKADQQGEVAKLQAWLELNPK
ncbi:DUF305 domain-containing protein [Aestuariivirga sp.]|uniref:DUF305 domain-containing protein n=1 Tax=Aestuariivirga sp. TaxID=2650926 RepID=UPI003BAB57B9